MLILLTEPNKLRCNNKVGFVLNNRKGYCTNKGIVATYNDGNRVVNLCKFCYEKYKVKYGST